MQTLDIISVNIWQIIISLVNLLIIFLIIKKFLYKPVKKMLEDRQSTIENEYSQAVMAKEQAEAEKKAYSEKIQGAKEEADAIIKNAVSIADQREKDILAHAKDEAEIIRRRAREDAELEIKKAEEGIKKEIVEVSSILTEKMLEREVSMDDHKNFIDSFIESIGDEDDAD
ncbi:MAG: F0F1 ATP synthase subunit B [Ruminococcaceae bacterium]|nr:F0F1 ATP synthase subunit B [Oscillospiraceae bacterium]